MNFFAEIAAAAERGATRAEVVEVCHRNDAWGMLAEEALIKKGTAEVVRDLAPMAQIRKVDAEAEQ